MEIKYVIIIGQKEGESVNEIILRSLHCMRSGKVLIQSKLKSERYILKSFKESLEKYCK